jgi:RimJ/RimL family protein N-acetyltransferase
MNQAPDHLLASRLKLRRWKKSDRAPFARLNASSNVMRYFPKLLTVDESNAVVDRIIQHFTNHEFGLWALELLESDEFIGFVGLQRVVMTTHFTPCVEVGWRLLDGFWGHGYAVEAAQAAMIDGFTRLKLPEIVAMTSLLNTPSIRVMQKLGMIRDEADDFDHPNIAANSELCRHLLYRLKANEANWQSDTYEHEKRSPAC